MFDYNDLTPKPISIDSLNDSYIGKKVFYKTDWKTIGVPYEKGIITSFNSKYVFVDFTGNGHGVACRAQDLLLTPKAQDFDLPKNINKLLTLVCL
jgi:hypothetical protein